QVDAPADELLDLEARRRAELPDRASALADEDPLLRRALDEDDGADEHRRLLLSELLHPDRRAVGDLLLVLLEDRFPGQLGRKEPQRLGRELVFRIQEGRLGQSLGDPASELIDTLA